MKTGTLAVMTVAALGVVGYAVWTLFADPGSTRATRPSDDETSAASDRDASAPPRRGKGGIKRVEPTAQGDARPRPVPGPRPPPAPVVSLETARADFAALIAEYDALLDSQAPLDNQRWVELYAKGAQALTPLQHHLHWEVEVDAQELRTAQEAYRTRIDRLQRLVVRPGAAP